MKNKWLNLVLSLTNRIYNQKRPIVGKTGFGAVYSVFLLILLEIILGIVSLPLYITLRSNTVTAFFSEKGSFGDVTFNYNLRRILTLTGVGIVASIWAVKLLLALLLPTLYGPLPLYSVTDLTPVDILNRELIAADTRIQTARVVNTIPRPILERVEKVGGGDYIFYGKAQPNSSVVLLLSNGQTAIYTIDTDKDGNWEITQSQQSFKLSEGNHSIITFGYDKELGVRSEATPEQYFKVTTSWVDQLVKNVDVIANWSVVVIIVVGVFLTFLTI